MITRKENLLVRPFQHRKYIQHRHKVVSALPRIDDVTPPPRSHVHYKCKKLQSEIERHAQIERDNFILLKHLNDIMTAKRIDNIWLYEQPKFQHRIKLFKNRSLKFPFDKDVERTEQPKKTSAKERCIACNPDKFITPIIIPEERVPWETKPVREFSSTNKQNWMKEFTYKKRLQQVPRQDDSNDLKIKKNSYSVKEVENEKAPSLRRRSKTAPIINQNKSERAYLAKNITKDRPLTVVMKFPPTTYVQLNAGIETTLNDSLKSFIPSE